MTTQSSVAGGADRRAPIPLTALLDAARPWSWFALRLGTGLLLVPHGMQKLFGMFGGSPISLDRTFERQA